MTPLNVVLCAVQGLKHTHLSDVTLSGILKQCGQICFLMWLKTGQSRDWNLIAWKSQPRSHWSL